jgi:hypothetical protein
MSAFFDRLLRRIKLWRQAPRPAAPGRAPVRLCLEALDERILPSAGPILTHRVDVDAAKSEVLKAVQEGLAVNLRSTMDALFILPTPNLVGARGSTVNLGLGTLTIQTESWDPQTASTKFTGTFESSNKIYPGGIQVSDDIGAIPVTGHIQAPFAATWRNGTLGGIPIGYFTSTIDFQGTGDGSVGSLQLPDHQQVSFTGSILTWWSQTGPLQYQYAMSGMIDIKDTVQNIPVLGTQTFNTPETVPGNTFAGMDWSPIQFL